MIGVTGAGRVLMKPAAPGTGVIAGGAARIILEEAGIHDVLCKSLGSANHINVARATVQGLQSLQRPDEVAARRGLAAEDFVPKGMLKAYNDRKRGAARRRERTEQRRGPPDGQADRDTIVVTQVKSGTAPSRRPAARCGRSGSDGSASRTRCPIGPRSAA